MQTIAPVQLYQLNYMAQLFAEAYQIGGAGNILDVTFFPIDEAILQA